jgi:hypothetical protein
MTFRKHHLCAAVVVGMISSLPAYADCVLPPAPSKIPDASAATQQEMVSAMQTLKAYNGDVDVYLKCLEFETKQNRLSSDEHAKKHNLAVSQLEKIAEKFNEQVRLFKAKNG